MAAGGARAQNAGAAFSCSDGYLYQVRQTGAGATAASVLYRVNRSTATYTTDPVTGGTFGTTGTLSVSGVNIVVNGLAYNSLDGYLYALTYPESNTAAAPLQNRAGRRAGLGRYQPASSADCHRHVR